MNRKSKAAWCRTPAYGIVRRLQQSGISAETAEEWVRLWESEAQRRNLDPAMADWWSAAWEWIAAQRRLLVATRTVAGGDPFDPVVTVESLHRAWERAEKRARELPPGSPAAAEAFEGVDQLWEAYERALGRALGRGVLGSREPGI